MYISLSSLILFNILNFSRSLDFTLKSILPSKDIVISFDDGYKSIIPAVDFANKLKFKTNVNIVTSKINHVNFLSKKEIKYLYDQSTNIGSHSHTHKDLTQLSTDLLENGPRSVIEMFDLKIKSLINSLIS